MRKTIPKTLPGFMELLPEDQIIFNNLMEQIKQTYELFGYTPLDTPVIENADVLLAKTGGETSNQVYTFKKGSTDLALRFDLTVPLAKYVSMHQDKLSFPFKRYQIGKVYRGEKPQKGRFREFYQCDIDIIGKDSLSVYADAEIVSTIYKTFIKLKLGKIIIKINNRKVLTGLLDELSLGKISTNVMRIIDKLDKTSMLEVKKALKKEGMEKKEIETLLNFISIEGNPKQIINKLKKLDIQNIIFKKGVEELEEVSTLITQLGVPKDFWKIDLSIARGLDYYTGTVYETLLVDYPEIGSVCSGGRFDDLASFYTDQKLPGVGVSIGLTRLFYKLNEVNLLNGTKKTPTKVLILPLGNNIDKGFSISSHLRDKNIPTQVYLGDNKSFKKTMAYASNLGVPWVLIVGDDEVKSNKFSLKNMDTGKQRTLDIKGIEKEIGKCRS